MERDATRTRVPLAAAAGACLSLSPAPAYADMGLVEQQTPDGAIVYFDFDGIGYAIILVVAIVLVLRSQRRSLRRMAARRKRSEAPGQADAPGQDVGAQALAAVERLKQAEQTARKPRRLRRGGK